MFNKFAPTSGSGGRWSYIVKVAKEFGFTEPDPRDGLNGLDVARKLTILGRLAGLPIESPVSFPVESLIPAGLDNVANGDEFLCNLPTYDNEMEQKRLAAEKAGKVVRFVGSVDILRRLR
jgi:homoserine dehydrogenase